MCRLLCVTGLGQNLTHPAWSNAGQLGDLPRMDALIPEGQHELAARGVHLCVPAGTQSRPAKCCWTVHNNSGGSTSLALAYRRFRRRVPLSSAMVDPRPGCRSRAGSLGAADR